MDKTLLKLDRLAVACRGVRLLEGIDLHLQGGELTGLTGPSGCGKTTLLRAIAGLIDPLEGQVLYRGGPGRTEGWPVYRRQVVLVEQQPVVFDSTVKENLARPFRYRSAHGKPFPDGPACQLLDRLGVGADRMGQNARSLSVGQQQRVCLVRAILVEPEVLLLDEPTSALDEDVASEVETLLLEIVRREDRSALIVTHDRRQVERWCDRCLDLAPHLAQDPSGAAGSEGCDE